MSADCVVAILKAWKENAVLCKTATTGIMASVGKTDKITRKEVAINADLLAPVVLHLGVLSTGPSLFHLSSGLRPALPIIEEAVEQFLIACRPRGRALPSRASIYR